MVDRPSPICACILCVAGVPKEIITGSSWNLMAALSSAGICVSCLFKRSHFKRYSSHTSSPDHSLLTTFLKYTPPT